MNNATIRSIIEKQKFYGPNFLDWYRNLRIVLRFEHKAVHLETPIVDAHVLVVFVVIAAEYSKLLDAEQEVACLMLASMTLEIQNRMKDYYTYDMLEELKTIFGEGVVIFCLCVHFSLLSSCSFLSDCLFVKESPKSVLLEGLGYEALIKRDTPNKLEPKSVKCILVGYPKEMMGYYFYYPPENKIFGARYGYFNENGLITQEASGSTIDLEKFKGKISSWISSEPLRFGFNINAVEEDRYGFYDDFEEHDYEYGDASRSWNKRFDEEIKKYGFTENPDESRVYQRASGSIVVFLILHVVDILLMGNNIPMLQDVKSWLGNCFAMKDLGEAAYILGIKIYRDRSNWLIGLSQSTYIDKILKKFKMENSKRGNIPMQEKPHLSKTQGASTPERPDVAFAQKHNAQIQKNPSEVHWTAVKKTPKYLRTTRDMFLVYGGDLSGELKLGVIPSNEEAMNMHCDNSGAIVIANELGAQK
ncbi:retrotransposon protein, putative, ty1-copia subclass [Tanacetum coccineum]